MKTLVSLLILIATLHQAKTQDLRQGFSGNFSFVAEYDSETDDYSLTFRRPGVVAANCFYYYNYEPSFEGFLSGSRNAVLLTKRLPFGRDTTFSSLIAEHGLPISYSGVDSLPAIYLDRVIVFWAAGTQPVPFNPTGSNDPYHIRLYATNRDFEPTSTIIDQRFRLQDFEGRFEGDETKSYPIQYPGGQPAEEYWLKSDSLRNYALMVEVINPASDDQLNLTFLSNLCVPDDAMNIFGLCYGRDPMNFSFQTGTNYADLYGLREEYLAGRQPFYLHTPMIIPILVPIEKPTGLPERFSMGQQGGLQLFNAYPIPAVDYTNLRFHLEHNDDVTIRVMDNTGREVRNVQFRALAGETTHTLDTRDLPCGAYSFIVQTHQGMLGSRFLIER